MGLILSNFKIAGHEFESPYAKAVITHDNGKIASFNILIYKSVTDRNLVHTIYGRWFTPGEGENGLTQAYKRITELATFSANIVTELTAKLEHLEEINTDSEDYLKAQYMLEKAKEDPMIQFVSAVRDEE